ncbi:hypothetical protein GCM10007342_03940 [Staphylococcus pragensis]|nr:hypothetical protein GCM10007342_03940 [Staphylococcus pragensis]
MPKRFIDADIKRWTLWLRAESLSLLFNNGVHHLYINYEQVRAHSELALFYSVGLPKCRR